MQAEDNYLELNRNLWNARVDSHLNSTFYDLEGFKGGRNSLTAPELELIGDVKGKKILHLQCHFGQETISLARLGASTVGIDLSDKAINRAQEFAEKFESFINNDYSSNDKENAFHFVFHFNLLV